MKYSTPRGTRDILPDESHAWRWLHSKIAELLTLNNYQEIQTPIFESADLFQRAVGETTDIVEKEMYIFQDKGDRTMALRPEGTASVVRAYLQHNALFQKRKVTKLFYQGPMFRYERPQTGRYRQFYQMGVEAIGSVSPYLDVETMIMGVDIFQKLGLQDVSLAVNSVGCEVCRPVIRERLKQFVESILSELCEDCQSRFDRNPLRILDCKNPTCQTYFTGLPDIQSALCHDCSDHFLTVMTLLDEHHVPHAIDAHLVRGLDYYTKTVFEIRSNVLGAQNAICGGGRYDNLIAEMGGRKTPAFGYAIGMDRLYMVLKEIQADLPTQPVSRFVLIGIGSKAKEKAFKTVLELRQKGIQSEFMFKDGGVNDGLKEALAQGATFAVILGEQELEQSFYTVKHLKEKRQFTVKTFDELFKL